MQGDSEALLALTLPVEPLVLLAALLALLPEPIERLAALAVLLAALLMPLPVLAAPLELPWLVVLAPAARLELAAVPCGGLLEPVVLDEEPAWALAGAPVDVALAWALLLVVAVDPTPLPGKSMDESPPEHPPPAGTIAIPVSESASHRPRQVVITVGCSSSLRLRRLRGKGLLCGPSRQLF